MFQINDHVSAAKASGNVYIVTDIHADGFYSVRRLRGGAVYGPTRKMHETSLKHEVVNPFSGTSRKSKRHIHKGW